MKWICRCGTTLGVGTSPDPYSFKVLSDVLADWMERSSADKETYVTILGRPETLGMTMCATCGRLWMLLGDDRLSWLPENLDPQRIVPLPSERDEVQATGRSMEYGRRLRFKPR